MSIISYENVNMLHHSSFKYHVDFFPLNAALSNFSAFFSNDSTVQANYIPCSIMTYYKTARGKNK